ncbi:MAG TPA: N-formylglutamate amidohydrolase [Cyclobacteriaceae bacterium]|nr:N-formylglutamate amidohydrolase [Cyclobacteriaceae bacterium]HRJ80406.1 N-formylglutamate amidohydrolase [Cyclobacteriaceae bacterium]
MKPFQVIEPAQARVPVLLSVPHCGTAFPDELKSDYKQDLIQAPDDTDWFVHWLYDFAPAMGITIIHAVYSRWVIDLNRDPQSKPLYSDGRIITGLCPTTTFFGEPIYNDERTEVSAEDIKYRVEKYYNPYHEKLNGLLQSLKQEFGVVLLWDCHSIRQQVPTIHKEKFPDLILGDADGTSASPGLIETAIKKLESGGYSFQHNYPFKGGYITRHYGRPSENQHALQLEMSKVNYMDDGEMVYDEARAEKMRHVLQHTIGALIDRLFEFSDQ